MHRTIRPLFAVAALAALALTGCAGGDGGAPAAATTPNASSSPTPATAAECRGVFVTVQYGLLGGDDVDACDPVTSTATAASVLKDLGITTAGTTKYGDQVVCRVNGRPSASTPIEVPCHAPYTEQCQSMPAAFAYWSMWVRDSAAGQWGYAQNGVAAEQLKPGQTLGLKFTTGTDTAAPQG